jgi:hypothetical protein
MAHQWDIKAIKLAVPIPRTHKQKTAFEKRVFSVAKPKTTKIGPKTRKLKA